MTDQEPIVPDEGNQEDRFFFDAFAETDSEEGEKRELVNLSYTGNRVDYVARVMCNGNLLARDKDFLRYVKKFLKLSEGSKEYNSAMIKVLRAAFNLDGGHSPRNVKSELTPEELIKEVNLAMLSSAMHDLTSEDYHVIGNNFREDLLRAAGEVSRRYGTLASRLPYREEFAESARGVSGLLGENLEEAVRRHEQNRMKIPDIEVYEGIRNVAQVIFDSYPVLHNKQILEGIVDNRDLGYTVCSSFAPELINTPSYKDAAIKIVKSKAPAKLKFVASMMAIDHDNFLQVADRVARLDIGGSYGSGE